MTLPKNAKRVFKGVIFDVYQWPQKMFDGSNATFEAIKRANTVVVLASHKGKMVMLKQKQPGHGWFLSDPAGRIDEGESPKHAAARELLEETGMKAKKLYLWKKVQPSRKILHTIYIFIAQNCKKIAEIRPDSGEKIKMFECSFEDWLKLSDNPNYIDGITMQLMLRAIFDPKFKKDLKKAIFG
jgi:ADP-ribose pyrophosphatase